MSIWEKYSDLIFGFRIQIWFLVLESNEYLRKMFKYDFWFKKTMSFWEKYLDLIFGSRKQWVFKKNVQIWFLV